MKSIRFLYVFLFAALFLGLFGLGKSFFQSWQLAVSAKAHFIDSSTSTSKKQVLILSEEASHPYWNVVFKGAQAAAGEEMWVDLQGPNKASVAEHTRLIERAIDSKVDAIITQGLDDAFVPVINKAVESGIPLITIDTDAPGSNRYAFVGTDNYKAGVQIGNYLKSHSKGPVHIGIISGNPYGQHMKLRIQGFTDTLQDSPDFHITATAYSKINKLEAVNQSFKMLSEHPEINVMFGVSALDGPGIAQAVAAYFPHRQIMIIAFDDMPETIELVRQGKIQATVEQESFQMGYQSIVLVQKILQKEPVPSINYTDSFIVDPTSLPEYLQRKRLEKE